MNIVIINTVCDTGSTGRIAANIGRLASKNGHNVYFAYGRGNHPQDINGYKIGNKLDFYIHVMANFWGMNGFASRRTTKAFISYLDTIKPDVIHLHNIHGFYINLPLLFDYIKLHNIKVIWTLHDCWSFTGHCAHFDYAGCTKWKKECCDCPIYRQAYPYSLFRDNSQKSYRRKKELFQHISNLTIVVPSHWLRELVETSFLSEYPVRVINNGIDLEVFNISHNGEKNNYDEVVLLAVANVWGKAKGLYDLYTLSEIIPDNYKIVIVGLSKKQKKYIENNCNNKILAITHTETVDELVNWYQKSDVFINPTFEDTFPTTNIEALACGTPVVTYATGGSPEVITSNNGMVCTNRSPQSILDAVTKVLNDRSITSESCRNSACYYEKNDRFEDYMGLIREYEAINNNSSIQ